jgi:phage anti-repressor protein
MLNIISNSNSKNKMSSSIISLSEYLKKYSTISSSFIDDFYGLYKYNTDESDFVIDLEVLAKWLKAEKKHLKETLSNTYINNIDYKVSKKEINTGGRKSELILLTPDCMKRLCMSSRTKKAEEVRTYFIELEKHIDKYKSYIIDGLSLKIGNLESDIKPIHNPKKGVIYVLRSNGDLADVYKIGKTKEFKKRLTVHQTSHSENIKVKLIYETNDIDSVETCLKGILKNSQYKKNKEFYQIKLDDLKVLIKGCDDLRLKAKYSTTRSKKEIEKNSFIYISKNK